MNNPEFRRFLWTEFSPARLLLAPVLVLLACATMKSAVVGGDMRLESAWGILMFVFGLLVFLWGSKLAGEAFADEVNQGTWVFQRMSGISAWRLAWGKLLGSTLYVWYWAFWIVAGMIGLSLGELEPLEPWLVLLAFALPLGVLAHSVSMGMVLLESRRLRAGARRIRSQGYLLIGVLSGILLSSLSGIVLRSPSSENGSVWHASMSFYSWKVFPMVWTWLVLAFLAGFGVVGLWRLTRRELLHRDVPSFSLVFLILCVWIMAGTLSNFEVAYASRQSVTVSLAFSVFLLAGFLGALSDSMDLVRWRRVARAWRESRFRDFWSDLGVWPVLIVLVVPLAAWATAVPQVRLAGEGWNLWQHWSFLTIVALAVRDIAVFLTIRLGTARKPEFFVWVYLATAYLLLPFLFSITLGKDLEGKLYPAIGTLDGSLAGLLSAMAQAGIAGTFLVRLRGAAILKPQAESMPAQHVPQ